MGGGLHLPLDGIDGHKRVARPKRLPEVLSREEAGRLLAGLTGTYGLIAKLLYGSGLRLIEGLRLRVKDVDLGRGTITVRSGKGDKDRVTMAPEAGSRMPDLGNGWPKTGNRWVRH